MSAQVADDGALSACAKKAGVVQSQVMIAQALTNRLEVRCEHVDLRRTVVSEQIESGADISAVRELAVHQSPTTNARYDRRGECVMKRAAEMLVVPYAKK